MNRTSFFLHRLKKLIPIRELKKHAYISGSTGSGKSELMRLLFYRIARESRPKKYSLVLIDPHGDLSQQIKRTKLFNEKERLIYVDP